MHFTGVAVAGPVELDRLVSPAASTCVAGRADVYHRPRGGVRTAITVTGTALGVLNLRRRMSFHFGNVHATAGPQALLTLDAHPDLFPRHDEGFVTLDVRDGRVSLDSVLAAPFGHAADVDPAEATPVAEWSVDSISE